MYVTCNLKGGLGNQLFQIFTCVKYCLENNRELIFLNCERSEGNTIRKTYWTTLFKNQFRLVETDFFRSNQFLKYNELKFSYNKLPVINANLIFDGYFQSSLYFRDIQSKILTIINSNNAIKNEVDKKYNDIRCNKPLVSLHVRRTDYLNLSDFHHNQSENYYKNSIYIIKNKLRVNSIKLVVFSDDVNYCEKNVINWIDDNDEVIYIKNNTDYMDLLLMSRINHNIIANSSFSWWGAYLNTNDDKIVIAPQNWFGLKGPDEWQDIYCKNWIIIKD